MPKLSYNSYSIYILWPFLPVWGVADNTKKTTKTMGNVITSANEVGEVLFSPLFVCLSVCEQLPDHNFSCGVMKLSGINCYVKIWK